MKEGTRLRIFNLGIFESKITVWFRVSSVGCGIGYGYLHRIPIRSAPDTGIERRRKSSQIPDPPQIKPSSSIFPPQTNETKETGEANLPTGNNVDSAPAAATFPPPAAERTVPQASSTIVTSFNGTGAPSMTNYPPPMSTNTSISPPLATSAPPPPPSAATISTPLFPERTQPEIPMYSTSAYPPQPFNPLPSTISHQMPSQYSTHTSNVPTSVPMANFPPSIVNLPPPTSLPAKYAASEPIAVNYPNAVPSASVNPPTIPAYSTGGMLSNYFSNAGPLQTNPTNQTADAYSHPAGLPPPSGLPPQVVSVTTPISLPGMPPITVSATLPYSAIEGLHIDPTKPITSSAAGV